MVVQHQQRIKLAESLLRECGQVYVTGDIGEDLSSRDNKVITYLDPEAQKKYVHMYFASYVSCWRELRKELSPGRTHEPVVSLGAGPCLCLMGWFYDFAPFDDQVVVAVDALDWLPIRRLDSFQNLMLNILKPKPQWRYLKNRYFPATIPPQVTDVQISRLPLSPVEINDIPDAATVLFPYVLNHVTGKYRPTRELDSLVDWLEQVRKRAARTVIVDMRSDRATEFWMQLQRLLGIKGQPSVRTANPEYFRTCYERRANWPNRRTSEYMKMDTAVLGTANGWTFL